MMMNFFGNNKNKFKQRQLKQKISDEDGGSSSKTDDIENNNGGGQNQQVIDESFEVKQQQSDGNEMQRRVKSGSKMVYIVLAFAAVSFGFATYVLLSAAKEQEFRSEVSQKQRKATESISLSLSRWTLVVCLIKSSHCRSLICSLIDDRYSLMELCKK